MMEPAAEDQGLLQTNEGNGTSDSEEEAVVLPAESAAPENPVVHRVTGTVVRRDVESLEYRQCEDDEKQPNYRLGDVEYAVGGRVQHNDNCASVSETVCPRFLPRLGNMVVLHHSATRDGGRSINCVVGPYWPMMLCVTYPLIAVISVFAGFYVFRGRDPIVIGVFVFGVLVTSGCLALTACSDPGILVRRREEPPEELRGRRRWTWNDQASTWRPAGAQYCRDCNVVVEGFDHTCPWTGTGIGRRNMIYFQFFTTACCCSLIYIFAIMIAMGGATRLSGER